MDFARPSTDAMMAATSALAGPSWKEYSIKIAKDGVRADRAIHTFPRRAFLPGPKRTLARMLSDLGCPGLGDDLDLMAHARVIAFGADGAKGKIYFEFPLDARPEYDLPLIGWKWQDGQLLRSLYRDRSFLMHAEKHALMAAICAPDVALIGAQVLDLTRDTDPKEDVMVLHMVEGDMRRNLDVSIIDSRLTVDDTSDLITALFAAYGQDPAAFLASQKTARLGHISFGRTEAGDTYVTIYYGQHDVAGQTPG